MLEAMGVEQKTSARSPSDTLHQSRPSDGAMLASTGMRTGEKMLAWRQSAGGDDCQHRVRRIQLAPLQSSAETGVVTPIGEVGNK